MRIEVRARGFRPTKALSAHVERQVSRSLSRLRSRPAAVVAYLSDLNGPRGGSDKLCRLRGHVARGGEVVATASGEDMYRAIGTAAVRLRRALVQRSAQRDARRRPRPRREIPA
jgi:ribosome-associated translation inhibitor RaiA